MAADVTDDPTPWLTGVLDRIEQRAHAAADCEPAEDDLDPAFSVWGRYGEFASRGGPVFEHVLMHSPARVLPVVAAMRAVLAEHAAEWQAVEWPHDQNGKGDAQVCRRCQNAEHTEWHPTPGEAGVLPDGFVAPYVLAPCPTVRALAAAFSAAPGFRPDWGPQ